MYQSSSPRYVPHMRSVLFKCHVPNFRSFEGETTLRDRRFSGQGIETSLYDRT